MRCAFCLLLDVYTRERCWLALGPLQAAQPQLSKRALNLGASTASHNRELDVEWMIVRAYPVISLVDVVFRTLMRDRN